jgi:acyl-CoA thioesterase
VRSAATNGHSCGAAQDLNAAPVRKKRGATSTLPGNAAKRAAADEPASWEAVASQAGWTGPEDALRHALRLKKNERNPQTVKSACLAYVQQLRALGWSLHSANERCAGSAACASASGAHLTSFHRCHLALRQAGG